MNKIIILGTSGYMKEQLEWIEDMMDHEKIKYKIIFCSDKKIFKNYDIISEKKIKKNIGKLYLAIGSPNIRSKLISKFKNFDFFSLIHPSAKISKNVKIGKGVTISPNCIITSNVKLGDFNNLNWGVGIFHDCKIDNNFVLRNDLTEHVKMLDKRIPKSAHKVYWNEEKKRYFSPRNFRHGKKRNSTQVIRKDVILSEKDFPPLGNQTFEEDNNVSEMQAFVSWFKA